MKMTSDKPKRNRRLAVRRLIVFLTSTLLIIYLIGATWFSYVATKREDTRIHQQQGQRAYVEKLKQEALEACLGDFVDEKCLPKLRPIKQAIYKIDGFTVEEWQFLSSFQLYGSAINSKSPDRVVDLAYYLGFLDDELKRKCDPNPLEKCDIPEKLKEYKAEKDPNRRKIRNALRKAVERKVED